MAITKTPYGLVYNEDGSLCYTERLDDIPFDGVTSWAVEEGTTNLYTQFNSGDAGHHDYDNTAGTEVLTLPNGLPFLRIHSVLASGQGGGGEVHRHFVLTPGEDYTMSYYVRANHNSTDAGYEGFYWANYYEEYTGLEFNITGTTATWVSGTVDWDKIKPDHNGGYLYVLRDASVNEIGKVLSVDATNKKLTLSTPTQTGHLTSLRLRHRDHCYHVPAKNFKANDDWKYEQFTFKMPSNYNDNNAYRYTNINFRLYNVGPCDYYLDIKYPQVEKKPYATSFVDGTRAKGGLQLPISISTGFAVSYWRKFNKPTSLAQSELSLIDDNNSYSFDFFSYPATNIQRFDLKIDGTMKLNENIAPGIDFSKWSWIVGIVDTATATNNVKIYINGILQKTYSVDATGFNATKAYVGCRRDLAEGFEINGTIANFYIGDYRDKNGNVIWTDDYIKNLYHMKKPFSSRVLKGGR